MRIGIQRQRHHRSLNTLARHLELPCLFLVLRRRLKSYRNRRELTSNEDLGPISSIPAIPWPTWGVAHSPFTTSVYYWIFRGVDQRRILTVIVHVLSLQMLDALAEKLPQPESLIIKVIFWDLKSNDSADALRKVGGRSTVGLHSRFWWPLAISSATSLCDFNGSPMSLIG